MSIQLIDTGTQNSKQCNNSAQGEKNKLVLYAAYDRGVANEVTVEQNDKR